MHLSTTMLLAAVTALALGARHGLDWDHLSAIADLVSSADRSRRSLGLALWYCIGHASVILLIGFFAAIVGVHLPGGIDRVFEVVVGVTLVWLGCLVLLQVVRQRRRYQHTSRWRLLLGALRRIRLRGDDGMLHASSPALSSRAACGIGVLHGTGAETPTQVVLFAGAASAGSTPLALVVLISFGIGLVVADLGVAVLVLSGRLTSARVPYGQLAMGAVTGLASVGIGLTFILERAAALPTLAGG